jgi:hypothetical protein
MNVVVKAGTRDWGVPLDRDSSVVCFLTSV